MGALLVAEPADLQEIDALVLTINGTNRSLPLGSATTDTSCLRPRAATARSGRPASSQ